MLGHALPPAAAALIDFCYLACPDGIHTKQTDLMYSNMASVGSRGMECDFKAKLRFEKKRQITDNKRKCAVCA